MHGNTREVGLDRANDRDFCFFEVDAEPLLPFAVHEAALLLELSNVHYCPG